PCASGPGMTARGVPDRPVPVAGRGERPRFDRISREAPMPMMLKGSCRCGAVGFSMESHTPHPYMRCYCSICRKTAGGGGYAVNLGANSASLTVTGREALAVYQAKIDDGGVCRTSTGERNFCRHCASALWLYDPTWP